MQWALRHPNMRETPTPMCTQPEFDSQSTRPTPQWSDTQDIGYPYSGSMSFTELLHSHWGPLADDAVPSQWQPQADEAGGSQWYPQSCVDQTPSQHILQTSGQIIRQNGIRSTIILVSDYTFMQRQGPSQAAGQRARQLPDNFTPKDFMHRQCGRRDHN
jgi:hypothetical protein